MKFVLVCLLGIVVSLIGLILVKKIMTRINQLEQIVSAINLLKEDIRYSNLETTELFTKLYKKFPQVFCVGFTDPSEFIENTIKCENLLLSDEEREDLRMFLVGIGKTDVKGQLEHTSYFLEKFQHHLAILRKKSANQIKVYPTLSILVGLMCVVLLV